MLKHLIRGIPTTRGFTSADCFPFCCVQEAEFVGSAVKQRKAGDVFAQEPQQTPPPRVPPPIVRPSGESDCSGEENWAETC